MVLISVQAAAVAAAAAAAASDSVDGGEVSALAADHIGRKAEPLDPAAEASEAEPSDAAAVESEDTTFAVQDEAAAEVGGSAAVGVADGSEGESTTEEVPLQQYQAAPALPVQPSLIRSSADDQTVGTDPVFSTASGDASASSEVLSQPSISTDEASAVVASHVSAGSAAEQEGTQRAIPAPSTVARQGAKSASTGFVPQTAVQTVLIPSSDRELGSAAAAESSAGDGPAYSEQQSVEEARSIDVLVTPQQPGSLASTGTSAVETRATGQQASAREAIEEEARTEEPYPESDRGGAAASDGSAVEEAGAVGAEDGEGTATAEPGEDSDGEARYLWKACNLNAGLTACNGVT